jgi:hypothetical protein
MGLVVAKVRRSAPDTPKRTTVSVSSNPSRRLAAESGLIRISQLAVSSSDLLRSSSAIKVGRIRRRCRGSTVPRLGPGDRSLGF